MKLRLGVVGVGHMGRLHVRKIEQLVASGADIVLGGVADVIPERARDAVRESSALWTHDFRELLPGCDALVVAVPTVSHYEVTRAALEAGIDVLVEKPIAATLAEAEALIDLAHRGGRILQVGHLEWFNAAMQAIHDHIHKPRFVEVHRLGPFTDRSTDVDVVRDLMIHDLDILQQVLGAEPRSIDAVGSPVLTSKIDIANARLGFPCGCVANLTASRVSAAPMRKIRFFQPNGYFAIDFLDQSAMAIRRDLNAPDGAPQIQVEKLPVDGGDALLGQLAAFVTALRTREEPSVNGSGGLGALRTALRVIDAMPSADSIA